MKLLTNILLIQLVIVSICSCASNKKMIEKSQTEFGAIKFFAVKAQGDKLSIIKLYADVDSNGIKRYYSFYPKGVVMTDERAKQLSYTVLFKQFPENFNKNNYHHFSRLDTLVFDKAEILLKSSKYSHLKSLKGANGYEIQVYYMHGFPKNKKFETL
jgi:hypothetical protein